MLRQNEGGIETGDGLFLCSAELYSLEFCLAHLSVDFCLVMRQIVSPLEEKRELSSLQELIRKY